MASICSPLLNLSLSRPPIIQEKMYPSNQQIYKSLGVMSQDLHILKLTPSPPSSGFLRPTIRDLGIIRSFLLKFCSLRVEPHIIWFRLFYNEGKKYVYYSVADVPESWVWLRADFECGSRVLKKVFWTFSYLYLWHTMWFHAKKLLKTLNR